MDDPVFIEMMLALHLMSFSSIIKFLIKANYSIFMMRATVFLVTCHLIIVFTLLKSFILFSFASDFFLALKIIMVFDTRRKSLTYTLIMQVLPSIY